MDLTGEKILSVLVDSLSVDELETLLNKKKNAGKPVEMSKEEKWLNHYKNEIIKLGLLHPPTNKV